MLHNIEYNPHIPNIDVLNSDTHTWSILILNSQFVGVANEVFDIWYKGVRI